MTKKEITRGLMSFNKNDLRYIASKAGHRATSLMTRDDLLESITTAYFMDNWLDQSQKEWIEGLIKDAP